MRSRLKRPSKSKMPDNVQSVNDLINNSNLSELPCN